MLYFSIQVLDVSCVEADAVGATLGPLSSGGIVQKVQCALCCSDIQRQIEEIVVELHVLVRVVGQVAVVVVLVVCCLWPARCGRLEALLSVGFGRCVAHRRQSAFIAVGVAQIVYQSRREAVGCGYQSPAAQLFDVADGVVFDAELVVVLRVHALYVGRAYGRLHFALYAVVAAQQAVDGVVVVFVVFYILAGHFPLQFADVAVGFVAELHGQQGPAPGDDYRQGLIGAGDGELRDDLHGLRQHLQLLLPQNICRAAVAQRHLIQRDGVAQLCGVGAAQQVLYLRQGGVLQFCLFFTAIERRQGAGIGVGFFYHPLYGGHARQAVLLPLGQQLGQCPHHRNAVAGHQDAESLLCVLHRNAQFAAVVLPGGHEFASEAPHGCRAVVHAHPVQRRRVLQLRGALRQADDAGFLFGGGNGPAGYKAYVFLADRHAAVGRLVVDAVKGVAQREVGLQDAQAQTHSGRFLVPVGRQQAQLQAVEAVAVGLQPDAQVAQQGQTVVLGQARRPEVPAIGQSGQPDGRTADVQTVQTEGHGGARPAEGYLVPDFDDAVGQFIRAVALRAGVGALYGHTFAPAQHLEQFAQGHFFFLLGGFLLAGLALADGVGRFPALADDVVDVGEPAAFVVAVADEVEREVAGIAEFFGSHLVAVVPVHGHRCAGGLACAEGVVKLAPEVVVFMRVSGGNGGRAGVAAALEFQPVGMVEQQFPGVGTRAAAGQQGKGLAAVDGAPEIVVTEGGLRKAGSRHRAVAKEFGFGLAHPAFVNLRQIGELLSIAGDEDVAAGRSVRGAAALGVPVGHCGQGGAALAQVLVVVVVYALPLAVNGVFQQVVLVVVAEYLRPRAGYFFVNQAAAVVVLVGIGAAGGRLYRFYPAMFKIFECRIMVQCILYLALASQKILIHLRCISFFVRHCCSRAIFRYCKFVFAGGAIGQ